MREVLFKQFIRPTSGIGEWKENIPGKFHQWAAAFEDYGEQGPGNYTVALVEELNGKIIEVHPTHIQFIP